jgi:hypothetical protein
MSASLIAVIAVAAASAQSAAAPELKAAYLFNFAKFSTWPGLPDDSPLVLCLVGDQQVTSALTSLVRGQRVDGRSLEVSKLTAGARARSCQLLFVSASELAAAGALLESARTLPILTVSDSEGFSRSGGMIELFAEGGRMRFAVNLDAVQQARVRMSSQLLAIAKIVHK